MTDAPLHPSRRVYWMLIGGCVGAAMLASACSSSRTPHVAALDLPPHDIASVETALHAPVPVSTPAPRAAAVTHFIEDALRNAGNISRSELLRHLGPPHRTSTEPVRNQYELGRTDTLHTLTYPGLTATLYEATQPARTFLIRLALTRARYTSPEGLHVGMPETRVLDRIGPPTERNSASNELIYTERASMPIALILTVQDGRVTQIAWEFYFS